MSTSRPDHVSLGRFVASLNVPRELVRDRAALLERSTAKTEAPTIGGVPMVGLGGSCGTPAFLLPFVARFTDASLARLEAAAAARGMFVEYGAYPHLKNEEGGPRDRRDPGLDAAGAGQEAATMTRDRRARRERSAGRASFAPETP